MILVDTSVWISYLNGTETYECEILDHALGEGVAAIGDMIYLEILQGFRHDKDYKNAKCELSKLDNFELFGQHMVEKCATNYRALRKKGITVRSTNDVIIATYCIENKLPLLFADKDFLPFVEHLNLRTAAAKT
ncbi:type II toxin-antitoxin system VapC family toxin [Porticoccus sp. GXU_MW_L64]